MNKRLIIHAAIVFLTVFILVGCLSIPAEQVVEEIPPAPVAEEAVVAEEAAVPAEVVEIAPEVVPVPVAEKEAEALPPAVAEKFDELHLISTSDVHGMIFPYNFITDTPTDHSLMQVSSYVKSLKAEGNEVVLLDNGDVLQGQPIVYYANFIDTGNEHIVAAVNNAIGYDVASVGNHDIEAGPEVYVKVADEADYPYVAANVVWEATGEPVIAPYVMIERGGLRIAVLGLTTPGVPSWLPANLYPGVKFLDMVESARKWIQVIQETEDADLIVGLFHSGRGEAGIEGVLNENGGIQVAEQVAGFDVIFTGHDHKDTNLSVTSPEGKDVLVVGALDGARTVADVRILSREGVIESIDASTVSMSGVSADEELSEQFSGYENVVKNWISREIGTITETVNSRDSMFGDSKFVDLIHRMQLELTEADISISAPLALDAEITEGPVYVRDMFALYPYENLLYTMTLTGKELDDMAEYSYGKWFNQMESLEDDLISFRRDADGNLIFSERYNSYEGTTRYYNYDSYAGVNYVVNITKPEGERVTFKTLSDGTPFRMDAQYTVAINSYRAQGGGGHLGAAGIDAAEAERRRLSSTVKDLRYYLMMLFEEQGEVDPLLTLNWKVLPSLWARTGMENSYDKLYGAVK